MPNVENTEDVAGCIIDSPRALTSRSKLSHGAEVLHGPRSEENLTAAAEGQIHHLTNGDVAQYQNVNDRRANSPTAPSLNINGNTTNGNTGQGRNGDVAANETALQACRQPPITESVLPRLVLIWMLLHFFNSVIRDTNVRQQLLRCMGLNLLQCGATVVDLVFDPIRLLFSATEDTLCVLVELGISVYFSMNGRPIWKELKQVMHDVGVNCCKLFKTAFQPLLAVAVCNVLLNYMRNGHPLAFRDEL